MKNAIPRFSSEFERLYCDAAVFASFSTFHPISFGRVLPFQSQDPVVDDPDVIYAEEAHLADRNDANRRRFVDAYFRCGLVQEAEATNLKNVIDFFDADFFDLMGLLYANAGMFICALRWYREFIHQLENQSTNTGSCTDPDGIYASVGYCLYSLGLFEEAISWSKSCIGPRQASDLVCRTLIGYEAQLAGGTILAIERVGPRIRYTISAPVEATQAREASERLKATIKAYVPFEEIYMDWLSPDAPRPEIQPEGYPFQVERDAGDFPRHKMNLIFAICGQADALLERGQAAEAKRLLLEAAMLEPEAGFVWERLKALT